MSRLIKIGNRWIGEGKPCFIIAEIGSNHNQSLAQAKKLIEAAVSCGADAVKFQSLNYQQMYAGQDLRVRSLFGRIELQESWYSKLKIHADRCGVLFFSSPCYLKAVELLDRLGVALYKIASPQTHSFPQLIRAVAQTGKPLIISTGYCDERRVAEAVRICEKAGNKNYALLHCVSQYPAKPENAQLAVMERLRELYQCPIGFSDHTLGIPVAIAAVARGANVIEKHITLDRKLTGPDHAFALEPSELKAMVMAIRDVETAIGTPTRRLLTEEKKWVKRLVYRVVAAADLQVGERLNGNVLFRRAPRGIAAHEESRWLKRKLKREVRADEVIQWGDLELA